MLQLLSCLDYDPIVNLINIFYLDYKKLLIII